MRNSAVKKDLALSAAACRRGSVGVHKDQALVLVNYNDIEGSDSAREILQLAQEIQRTVKTEFGIDLEVEPRIYGSL